MNTTKCFNRRARERGGEGGEGKGGEGKGGEGSGRLD